MIAALYVQTGGVYFGLPNVDPWDEKRDARLYAGPWPVVAHPPCQLWVNFAALNFKRWGGEHNRPGNDGGRFLSALRSVERFGGILEHPAFSLAWARFGLATPHKGRWTKSGLGWVAEVAQSAYGHPARKLTWLFAQGVKLPELDWSRPAGTAQCGFFDRIKPTIRGRAASATPLPFRDLLISIAKSAAPSSEPAKEGTENG